jgi:hypothetical protein
MTLTSSLILIAVAALNLVVAVLNSRNARRNLRQARENTRTAHGIAQMPAGVVVNYTDEPWQDAMLAKFAAAGFKYDGFGGWQADLTTTELLALGGALGVKAAIAPLTDEQIDAEWMRWNLPKDSGDALAFGRLSEEHRIRKAFTDGLKRGAAIGVAGAQGDKA